LTEHDARSGFVLLLAEPPTVFDRDRTRFGQLRKARVYPVARQRRGPARAGQDSLTDDAVLDAISRWTGRYGEPPARTNCAPTRAWRARHVVLAARGWASV
jgi:hypothetical protein